MNSIEEQASLYKCETDSKGKVQDPEISHRLQLPFSISQRMVGLKQQKEEAGQK